MTLGGEMFKKVILGLILCLVGIPNTIFGQARVARFLDPEDEAEFRFYGDADRLENRRNNFDKRITENENKIAKARKAKNNTKHPDFLDAEALNALEKQVERDKRSRNALFSPGIGRIVADSIAGQKLLDNTIEGVGDGIWKGVTARTSQALGEVISDRAKVTIEKVLGGTWDSVVGSLVDGFNDMNLAVFHNSKKPFDGQLINGWFELIIGTLRDIEHILKDYLKESSRGHDKTLRQFDGEQKAEEMANGWRDLIAGHVEVFDDIITDIEQRKEYYNDENDPIIRFANQIQKRLLKFKNLLISAKTIKDLDTALDSNRSIVEALRGDLERLFRHLTELVKPKTYSMDSRNVKASRGDLQQARGGHGRSRLGGRDYDDEDPFPGTMR